MPVDPPFNVYRDQLTSQYHGLALWNPNPPKTIYNHVSIGDVGYVREGLFIRMFNVILPWDHESNRTLGEPEPYESLDCGPFTKVLEVPLKTQEHYSRYVSAETNDSNAQAKEPDNAEGVTYNCRGHGALLLLPQGGRRADIIRTKAFEDYIRDHVVSWFAWAQKNQQGVERMEDLILVSGCTLVSSWAAAAFVYNSMEAKISLARRSRSDGGESFVWGNIRGAVEYHDSNIEPQNPPTTPDQCVFIRGFRAKRVLFWTKPMRAAAEPRPDDPDDGRDDEIQVSRVPDGPKYRDPLVGILDYIVERCPKDAKAEDTIAIAHDDDLRLIKDVEILTADAIEEFLREKQMPLLVENGAAILRDTPGTRQITVTIERHEGQSQKEAPSPPPRRLAKAVSMSLLGNKQYTPQFGSLSASRTSQSIAEKDGDRSQQGTLLPSPRRLAKAASMSALGDRQSPITQFGSLLASGTSEMLPEIHEDRLQRVTASSVGPGGGMGNVGIVGDPYRRHLGGHHASIKFRLKGAQHSGISVSEALERVRLSQGTAYLMHDVSMDHSGKILLKIRWSGYRSNIYSVPLSTDYQGYVDMQSLARRTARAIVHFMDMNGISLSWNRVVVDRLEENPPGVWIPVLMTH